MKKFCFFCLWWLSLTAWAQHTVIRIGTDQTDLLLQVGDNGRLYQTYLGERLLHESDLQQFTWSQPAGSDGSVSRRGWEAYATSGNEDFFEPALGITHADGNMTTYLYYKSHETHPIQGGQETIIQLADNQYPVQVALHYATYPQENVIKTWTEISHTEKTPVTLNMYASSMLYFRSNQYYLTEFSSDWAREVQMSSQPLLYGKKVIDTKLGSRAAELCQPFFEVGIDQPVSEQQGQVLMGTLGWTGNFRFTFEVDNVGNLRVISGINPYASAYQLKPGEVFTTPEFIFTLSQQGSAQGSRSLHQWALKYQLKDGQGSRLTLLNNWENTGFNFNQEILAGLMHETKHLGVDMFLLDDGWFGNGNDARNDDHAGLGDWEVNHSKLPQGIPALVKAAQEAGVKFGIWIEPEMVNPRSALFRKHPEWAITQPNREPYYYRNQLVLDMANPKVQDYVFGVVEQILKENPEVAFFKWDCNSPITNIYSPYLKERQSQLYVDHVRGVYKVMQRVKEQFPQVPMMLCSGGGARCDYEALKYFTEFWCSDNTDPIERCYIQWGFSQFFPAKAMCAHVTSWNKNTSVKFRTDVASMCKLGFDLGLKELSPAELAYCQGAVANWKRLQTVILDGMQYRLVSPYETHHMAVNYVSADQQKAVVFAYDLEPRYQEPLRPVRLQGLNPQARYQVKEINLMPNTQANGELTEGASSLSCNGQVYTGDYLMKVGLNVLTARHCTSHVLELTVVD